MGYFKQIISDARPRQAMVGQLADGEFGYSNTSQTQHSTADRFATMSVDQPDNISAGLHDDGHHNSHISLPQTMPISESVMIEAEISRSSKHIFSAAEVESDSQLASESGHTGMIASYDVSDLSGRGADFSVLQPVAAENTAIESSQHEAPLLDHKQKSGVNDADGLLRNDDVSAGPVFAADRESVAAFDHSEHPENMIDPLMDAPVSQQSQQEVAEIQALDDQQRKINLVRQVDDFEPDALARQTNAPGNQQTNPLESVFSDIWATEKPGDEPAIENSTAFDWEADNGDQSVQITDAQIGQQITPAAEMANAPNPGSLPDKQSHIAQVFHRSYFSEIKKDVAAAKDSALRTTQLEEVLNKHSDLTADMKTNEQPTAQIKTGHAALAKGCEERNKMAVNHEMSETGVKEQSAASGLEPKPGLKASKVIQPALLQPRTAKADSTIIRAAKKLEQGLSDKSAADSSRKQQDIRTVLSEQGISAQVSAAKALEDVKKASAKEHAISARRTALLSSQETVGGKDSAIVNKAQTIRPEQTPTGSVNDRAGHLKMVKNKPVVSPEVHIGQVDVVIETTAPAVRNKAKAPANAMSISRHYLRVL